MTKKRHIPEKKKPKSGPIAIPLSFDEAIDVLLTPKRPTPVQATKKKASKRSK